MMWMKLKKFQKKNEEGWEGVKEEIETINGGEYWKDLKKNRFESNNDVLMNEPIKLRLLTITIRCFFSEGSRFYPQVF